LRDTQKRILDIAVEYGYNSQEAFTRSFIDAFDITPAAYRKLKKPIPLYLQRCINHQHNGTGADTIMKDKYMKNVNVTFIKKPARKIIFWHREGASDYHKLCEAEGAEKVWGMLLSMTGTLGGIIAAWLNEDGKSRYVWGVEMPLDYSGPIPDGFEYIEAPECEFVKFCHPQYSEEEHEDVTEAVWNMSELWKAEENGYRWDDASNPVYEDDREDEGYMVLKPVKRI
jgi:hypothetical protein